MVAGKLKRREKMNSSVEGQAVNRLICSPFEKRIKRDTFSSVAGLIFLIIVNILAFPTAVLLNVFVMAAVKTKRRLREQKLNILVATLAFTDFITGVIIQPIFIGVSITALLGKDSWSCSLQTFTSPAVGCVFSTTLIHLVLLSGERLIGYEIHFQAYKFHHHISFTGRFLYGLVVISNIHVCIFPFHRIAFLAVSSSLITLSIAFITFCHVTVFCDVRRHQRQIAAHQVTQEAREHLARAKKAFNLTFTIVCVLVLYYLPVFFYRIVSSKYANQISRGNQIFSWSINRINGPVKLFN